MSAVLSTTAGSADAVSFLALGGLFAAHITGNLVILSAHYLTGGFGQIGPLLSVPVFVGVVSAVTVAAGVIERTGSSARRALLVLHAVLLAGCLTLAVVFGPFTDPDRPVAVLVGTL